MVSETLLFMAETPMLDFYYDKYVAFKHYIPVKPDFSDIIEKFEWAESH
jgi:hypothetical protein